MLSVTIIFTFLIIINNNVIPATLRLIKQTKTPRTGVCTTATLVLRKNVNIEWSVEA